MKYPIKEVKITCPIPVIREIVPTFFMTFGSKFNPTRNRRRATPISENVEIISVDFIILNREGENRIPVRMYPRIKGCLRNRIIPMMTTTVIIIKLSSIKKLLVIFHALS